jgi:hypothetical protein
MMINDPELIEKLMDNTKKEDHDDEEQDLKSPLMVVVDAKKSTTHHSQLRSQNNNNNKGSGGSCCKCILITMAILVTLSLVLGAIAMTGTYMVMKDVVEHLTVTTPHATFPVVDMTDAELDVVKDRVVLFIDQLRAKANQENKDDVPVVVDLEDLVVTQEELNGFIGHSDYLRGNYIITLEPGWIKEEYSLPTAMLPGGDGRYFVGSDYLSIDDTKGDVEVELETAATHDDWFDGPLVLAQLHYLVNQDNADQGKPLLELYLTKGSLFGQEASADVIAHLGNLLESLYDHESDCEHTKDVRAVLDGIERVSIQAGKIVISPRKSGNNNMNDHKNLRRK